MSRASFAAFALALASLAACTTDPAPAAAPILRLARSPDGRVALELVDAPAGVRALQVELAVDSSTAFTLEDPAGPTGVPIDTVKMAMRGTNRAILFAGDKRGVTLPSAGTLATFAVRASSSPANGTLSIASAVVVSSVSGDRLDVRYGPAIAVR